MLQEGMPLLPRSHSRRRVGTTFLLLLGAAVVFCGIIAISFGASSEDVTSMLKAKVCNEKCQEIKKRMKALVAKINGDFDSMIDYGHKVGKVPTQTESIKQQVMDGSLLGKDDIPAPPPFHQSDVLGDAAPGKKLAAAPAESAPRARAALQAPVSVASVANLVAAKQAKPSSSAADDDDKESAWEKRFSFLNKIKHPDAADIDEVSSSGGAERSDAAPASSPAKASEAADSETEKAEKEPFESADTDAAEMKGDKFLQGFFGA